MSGLLNGWAERFTAPVRMAVQQTDAGDSDRSVGDTVALMGAHAVGASHSKQVARAIEEAGCLEPSLTDEQVISKVFTYIKDRVTFTEDESQLADIFNMPASKELLITPQVLLSMAEPRGDCDDFSMLCCAMLMACGVACNFVTVAADSAMPTQFSHVYCQAVTEQGTVTPLDCSHGKYVGWETGKDTRKQVWPVMNWNKGRIAMNGLGDYGDGNDVASYPGAGGTDWGSILAGSIPGIFTAAEKIAIQTTQKPGYQTVGPNGTSSSYVLQPGSSVALALPGLSTSGSSSVLIYGAIGVAVLLLFAKMK